MCVRNFQVLFIDADACISALFRSGDVKNYYFVRGVAQPLIDNAKNTYKQEVSVRVVTLYIISYWRDDAKAFLYLKHFLYIYNFT